ncbi:MAG: Mut7-C RNAse domain-containing protein [Haloarculaceae archaeon]
MTDDDADRVETGGTGDEPTPDVGAEREPTADGNGPSDSAAHTPADTALLVDDMLGKLATYLRMCGYDATYTTERGIETEADALAKAHTEDRLVVTRDRELADRAERATLLTTRDITDQLRELREAGFELALADEPVRCSACNGLLERVDRTEPTPDYAPDPHEEAVWRCRECGQHFWQGSHWDDVAETLATL